MKNIIITQARNETKRLENWIAYHQSQGFDGLIYYDDYSNDDTIDKLGKIKEKYGFEIFIKKTDDAIAKKYASDNPDSYGGGTGLHYRIIRSFNSGLRLAKGMGNDILCALIDVDEFLVSDSNDNIASIIRDIMAARKINHLYIHSFDVSDKFSFNTWITTQPETINRWDYRSRQNTNFRGRGKSVVLSSFFERDIIQAPNNIHALENSPDGIAETSPKNFFDFSQLRIHHFRKPTICNKIVFCQDDTLYKKTINLDRKLNK
jgi:hypothetical protein